ncbi:response regulator [Altererythrobacter fulvus]|uniref:response regulator n=1 Tax=Caenibius fulvus TaxID=2126012 RepID=UPI00301A1ECF
MTNFIPTPLDDLPLDQRAEILTRRLRRTEKALHDAEAALLARMIELDQSNRDLRSKEQALSRRLDVESRKLLTAQRTARIATFHSENGANFSSSEELAAILGLEGQGKVSPEDAAHLIHPLDLQRVFDTWEAYLASDPSVTDHEMEHRLVRPDGQMRWLHWSVRREMEPDGTSFTLYGSVKDVTEARRTAREMKALRLRAERRVRELDSLTRQLEAARLEAERALSARTRFLSAISHQLRTPLDALSGIVSLLEEQDLPEEAAHQVRMASYASGQLVALIEALTEEAEGTSPPRVIVSMPLDLAAQLGRLHDFWEANHPAAAKGLTVEISPRIPAAVLGDAHGLREILQMLVDQAFSSGAESVALRADWSGGLSLSITGTGAEGWADDLAASDPSTIRLPGIRVACRLVLAMGGHFRVPPGHRDELIVEIPLRECDLPTESVERKPVLRTAAGEAPAILVVEDTATNRYVMVQQLEAMGCITETAENGAQALDAVRHGGFDVILMDVMMPVMSGEEATRAIRSLEGPVSRTPIIGITAHGLQEERERMLAAGMSACLTKPVRRDALRAALLTSISAGNAGAAASALIDVVAFRKAFLALPQAYRKPLLEAVHADIATYGAAISQAVKAGDEEEVKRAAHSLKGVAVNVGAVAILEKLSELRERPLSSASRTLPPLEEAIAATLAGSGDLFARLIEDQ